MERQPTPDERAEATQDDETREESEEAGREEKREGEGAGPAEDLQEDPAYNPQGPERDYKGG